jgi:predicted transcriptional regulator of viral defense system
VSAQGETGGLTGSGRRELASLLTRGARTVNVDQATATLNVSRQEAARRLAGWASRGWLRRVKRGLYLAVPMDAPDPAAWSEDPWYLADLAWSPCYVTGWSAANHWSLTDQVFRATVIATTQRVRRVEQELAGNAYLVHHVDPERLSWGLRTEWRHERRVMVAAPARTVAELLASPALGGGIRHVAEILDTYLAGDESSALVDSLDRLANGAAFKRLGYLAERLDVADGRLIETCEERITAGVVRLDPALPAAGHRSSRWGLLINAGVEV